mgnify:CR=1 FL=1
MELFQVSDQIGEEYDLNNIELSMYDYIIGAQIVIEMGKNDPETVGEMKMGLEWFRENNNEAYLALLE